MSLTCPRCGHDVADTSTYSAEVVASMLGVSVRTVQRMVRSGQLVATAEPARGRVTLIDGDSVRAEAERRSIASTP